MLYRYESMASYNATVTPFNYDLDNVTKMVFGTPSKVSVVTSGSGVPKPFNLKQGSLDQTVVALSWTRPTFPDFNVSWYFVEAQKANYSNLTSSTSISITGLTPYTKMVVEVRGCTGPDFSFCGHARVLSVWTDAGAPSAPFTLELRNISTNMADLQWQAPTTLNGPLSGYSVNVFETVTMQLAMQVTVDGRSSQFRLTNLTAGMDYTVEIRAFNFDSYSVQQLSSSVAIAFQTVKGEIPKGEMRFLWPEVEFALVVMAGHKVEDQA
ncbi:phosphotidylinositol phosphatase PTPRQ-like [Tropilaelaps mercedesae]|uniref:Phosphotidylinositol phosphatase PTPRQ-like n=1 Tax=Tropilaelaps mercedesae TaxID=418985 RepID=A0A1V9XFK2_9ACAR|nr:phosphotidylinositol phosphatase PTPRQ-like [Tropilaelaps mercedesae]